MTEIKVYGTTWCFDCTRAKLFLDKHNVDYAWINLDEEPQFVPYILEINNGQRSVPTIVFADGSVLVEPTNRALANKLAITV